MLLLIITHVQVNNYELNRLKYIVYLCSMIHDDFHNKTNVACLIVFEVLIAWPGCSSLQKTWYRCVAGIACLFLTSTCTRIHQKVATLLILIHLLY